MDPAQCSGAVPDPLRVLILSGPLFKPDKDALRSYIQTDLQLLYPYREAKVDLCPLPNHSLRSRLEDLTKLSTFVEKHDKHDLLRYDWVLPLFYLPPLTEPMYLDIEEDVVNIAQGIALEAAKTAKHVLFTTIAQSITKPSIASINELNEEIKKLGTSDGSHLLDISALLDHRNNAAHSQTYSLTTHRIAKHIAFYEQKWDNEEKLGLYHLSEQTKNILPCDSEFFLEKTVKPVALYRPFLTQGCAQFVQLQGMMKDVRVELDFRCAQNMAKDDVCNPLQGIKINNATPLLGTPHSPSIVDQAFQKLNTTLRGIPDISITTAAPPNSECTPPLSQLNYPGINTFRPSRVMAASYVASLAAGVEVARVRGEEMTMGRDGIRRPATINGMWRLGLSRPLQVVNTNNPVHKGRGRIIREVVKPSPEPNKRTHSAAVEDEDEVLVVESEPEPEPSPSKRTHSTAFSAAEDDDEDDDDVALAQRRQQLHCDEVMPLEEIVREKPSRVVERPSRAARGPNAKYVKRRAGGDKGAGKGRRKGKGRK